jgi:single-stranded DNA-binding protein
MRGLNKVFLSGNVTGAIEFGRTGKGDEVCGFHLASDRHTSNGGVVTAFIKVNVYIDGLVRVCKSKLNKGVYVLVEGELMNREGQHGELTEVRAREILFLSKEESKGEYA